MISRISPSPSLPGVQGDSLLSERYTKQIMPPVLSTIDLGSLLVLVLLFLTNVPNIIPAGPAAFTYWIFGCLCFFVPALLATAQLALAFPFEGGIYNWTYHTLGPRWSLGASFMAWCPAIPLIVSTPALMVSVLQGLNPGWFTEPWQQFLFITSIVLLSAILSLQPAKLLSRIVNLTALLFLCSVGVLGLAGVVWLLQGHPSATNFGNPAAWIPSFDLETGNLAAFGVIGLTFMGIDNPVRLLGECKVAYQQGSRKLITHHLFIGGAVVLLAYWLSTFSLLAVQGEKANYTIPALVSVVDQVFGKFVGNMMALTLLLFLVVATAAYQVTYARLLFVAGIDQHIPVRFGKVNRARVPSRALAFQTILAVLVSAFIYLAMAYGGSAFLALKPIDVANATLQVILASLSVVWVLSTLFIFIDLLALLYRKKRFLPVGQRLLPEPLLAFLSLIGLPCGLLIMGNTIFYPWTTVIPNTVWWYLIIGVSVITLMIAAVMALFGNSQAAFEGFGEVAEE